MNEHTSDPEEFRLVMETISQTIPDLLEKVNKILFEGQDGAKVGNSVAASTPPSLKAAYLPTRRLI